MRTFRPRRHPLTGAIVFSLLTAWLVPSLFAQEDPSWNDTVDFIRTSIEEHGDFKNVAGGGRLRVKLSDVLGKRFRVKTTISDGTPGGAERNETSEYALASLDPDTTHVRVVFIGDRQAYAVWIADSGRGGGVRIWPEGNEDLGAKQAPAGWIAMDSEESAQAMVKAINHAIKLSGGKSRGAAGKFFGATPTVRSVPATPITDGVYHVVSLDDAVALLRARFLSSGAEAAKVSTGEGVKGSWAPVALKGTPLMVTLPSGGTGFETNIFDGVRFDWPASAKGKGLGLLLTETEDFLAAGISPMRGSRLPCDLIQLPVAASQLPPLGDQIPPTTGVRLWTSVGEAWPEGESGFAWLARKKDGAREWRVKVAPIRKSKDYGPDVVKSAASEFGLKPSEALAQMLSDRAKAERAARRAAQ